MKQGRRRTGKFSDGGKYPAKLNGGLDWDQIRKDRAARLEAELEKEGIQLGVEHDIHVQGLTPAQEEQAALARLQGLSPTPGVRNPRKERVYIKKRQPVDVEAIVRMYVEENVSPRKIAPQVGLAYETVIKYLKSEGVWDENKFRRRPKEGGIRRAPRTSCPRNHDLTNPDNVKAKWVTLKDGTKTPSGTECLRCRDEKSVERWRDSRIKQWREAPEYEVFSCRQYLTYLLRLGGMTGAQAKAKCFELNRIFTGISILEKRTKLAWETSNHHEFIEKERRFNG